MKASPFIRSVATATSIAKQIGIEEVIIDSTWSEWLETRQYATNPVPHLEIRNNSPEELNTKFNLQDIKIVNLDETAYEKLEKVYPENDL